MWADIGEWKPDLQKFGVGNIASLNNVYPTATGYSPMHEFVPVSEPIIEDDEPAAIRGSATFTAPDGENYTFAGTDSHLYLLSGTEWLDVTPEGGLTGGVNTHWRFAMYGNYVLATNYVDPVQYLDVTLLPGAKFSLMSATAPKARSIAVVNEFVVLIGTNDTIDGERPSRVWWGPIADPTGTWAVDQTTMCDYQDMGQGSYCVAIVGGDTGVIFMRNAIIRMTFVGSPLVFQFDVLDNAHGCLGIDAVANFGGLIPFVSSDGLYILNNSSLQQVGLEKVDKYVLDRIPAEALTQSRVLIDARLKCIWFGLPDPNGVLNEALVYHYPTGKWGRVDITRIQSLHNLTAKGYTLDELDAINPSVDLLPFSLDSIAYKGATPIVGGFDYNGRLVYSFGGFCDGFIETADIPLQDHERRTFAGRVRVGMDGDGCPSMKVSAKQSLFDELSYGSLCTKTRVGDFAFRRSGRFHRFYFNLSGEWYNFTGFDIDVTGEGRF